MLLKDGGEGGVTTLWEGVTIQNHRKPGVFTQRFSSVKTCRRTWKPDPLPVLVPLAQRALSIAFPETLSALFN